jgi:branched-chain amino acid transport system permease protein
VTPDLAVAEPDAVGTVDGKATTAISRTGRRAAAWRVRPMHLGGIVLAVVGLAIAPFVLTIYPLTLVTLSLVYGLFAFGLDLAWGRAGIVSIGHAGFFGIGAYAVAIAHQRELSMLVVVPVVVLGVAALALVIGYAGLRRGTSASTMAVLTLALTLLAEQSARTLLSLTNGSNGLFVPSSGVVGTYYRTAAIVFAVVLAVWCLVIRGQFGRRMLLARMNASRTEHLGVDPHRVRIQAFVLSAVVAAIAGAVAAPVVGLVSPSIGGIVTSTEVLVLVAIGGRGSICGVFLGALAVTVGEAYLGDAIGSWYLFIVGLLFVVVVRFAPGGLVGLVRPLIKRHPADVAAQGAVVAGRSRRARGWEGRGGDDEGGRAQATGRPAVEVRDVVKRFDASVVLDHLDLQVAESEVVCLIGPNGAGKTTALNVIAGSLRATSGSVHLDEEDVTGWTPHRRARHGLGRLFQAPSFYPELTPAQNVFVARSEAYRAVDLPAELTRFDELDDVRAGDLSLADQRSLELAIAFAWGPRTVLLDEPAAGLSHAESIALARTLRGINRSHGCTLVVVEHDMEIVRQLGDRVVVLADGKVLVSGDMDTVADNDEVRAAYLGSV